jgi:hypothetical protein
MNGAAAADPAAADAPAAPQGSFLSSLSWRRCTVEAPSFLQPPARPGVPARSWTFSYPAFLYIPRAQRMPLLIVWTLVIGLALMRWLSASSSSAAHSRPSYASPSDRSHVHQGSRTYMRGERFDLHGSDDEGQAHFGGAATGGAAATGGSGGWTTSTPRSGRRGRSTSSSSFFFFSPDSVFTLLTLLFFLAPMMKQWVRQVRQEYGPRVRAHFGQ